MSSIGASDSSRIVELQKKVDSLETKLNNISPQKVIRKEAVRIDSDKISTGEVKRGFVPGVKSFFAGAGVGAGVGLAGSYIVAAATNSLKGEAGLAGGILIASVTGIGLLSGGVAGATVSQITADRGKGALIGAGIGAGVGTLGALIINPKTAIVGAVAGGLTGAAGGYVGSSLAKTE